MVMIIMWLSLLISSIFTWLLLASMGPLDGWAFSIWLAVDIKVLIIDAFMSFFYILLHIYWYWIEARTLCILPEYTVLHEGVPVETCFCVFRCSGSVHGSSSCAALSFCFSSGPTSGRWLKMISTSSTCESFILLRDCDTLWPRVV